MRVLVVDDDRAVRDALRGVLTLARYEVQSAEGGAEAIEAVVQSVPDAVVLDVGMPEVEGLQVCERLRQLGNRVPILMLTARVEVSDRVAGLDAGADDYLVKPLRRGRAKGSPACAPAQDRARGRPRRALLRGGVPRPCAPWGQRRGPGGGADAHGSLRRRGGLHPVRLGRGLRGGARRPGTTPPILPDARERRIAAWGRGSALEDRTVKGTHLRVYTIGTPGGARGGAGARGAPTRGAVMIARPLGEVDHELDRIVLILSIVGLAGIAIAALLGALVARTALAPIARFTRRTEALAGELDLSERLQVSGGDEQVRLRAEIVDELDELTTSRVCSSASIAPRARTSYRARGSGWRSCVKPLKRTAGTRASNAAGGGALLEVSFGPAMRLASAGVAIVSPV